MGKFINVKYKNTVDSLVDGFKNHMKNPYYMFTDSKPTLVTYYNQNTHKTSLDHSLENGYNVLGKDANLRFNRIHDFYLYGIDKLNADLQDGDFGLESSPLEGEAVILPNTIIPIPNDHFTIHYEDKKLLFRVMSVNVDTIENGVNFYKIDYKMDKPDDTQIIDQIVDDYTMIINNVGTNFKAVIRKDEFDFIDKLDTVNVRLKEYYKALFYSDRVQTFIFCHNMHYFYDPTLIEFIIRNELMEGSGEYLFIDHQINLNNTFPLDYDRTFLHFFECPDLLKNRRPLVDSKGKYIDDELSIFSTRMEDYFKIEYLGNTKNVNQFEYTLNNFDHELLDRILNNNKYPLPTYKDIFIKYCNDEEILPKDIFTIEDINFEGNMDLFYQLPILIFIIEKIIKKILVNKQ